MEQAEEGEELNQLSAGQYYKSLDTRQASMRCLTLLYYTLLFSLAIHSTALNCTAMLCSVQYCIAV